MEEEDLEEEPVEESVELTKEGNLIRRTKGLKDEGVDSTEKRGKSRTKVTL